jgi:hypothetical protein
VGADGLRLWFWEVKRARLEHTLSVTELKDTAADQMLATGSVDLPGSPNAAEFFGRFRFADGLIARVHHYISDRRTMENVGLAR